MSEWLHQIDSRLIYDGTERIIGEWFGDPLYSLGTICTTAPTIQAEYLCIDLSDKDIKSIISMSFICDNPDRDIVIGNCTYRSANNDSRDGINFFYRPSSKHICCFTNDTANINKTVRFIITYTKNTHT